MKPLHISTHTVLPHQFNSTLADIAKRGGKVVKFEADDLTGKGHVSAWEVEFHIEFVSLQRYYEFLLSGEEMAPDEAWDTMEEMIEDMLEAK